MKYLHYAVGALVVITGHNGEARSTFEEKDIVGQIVIDPANVPDVFKTAGGEDKSVKAYGINSLLQDRSSQAKGQEEKFNYMKAEAERLQAEGALWSEAKESAPKAPKAAKVDALLAQAVAELKGCQVSVATAMLGKLGKEEVAALAAKDAVKAKIEELRAVAAEAAENDLEAFFDL